MIQTITERDRIIEDFSRLLEQKKEIVNNTKQELNINLSLTQINEKLKQLSLIIQKLNQNIAIMQGKVESVPHIDDRLRAGWLREDFGYTDRLCAVLSRPEHYIKENKTYLETEINKPGYLGKKRNIGAVREHIRDDFLKNSFVLDIDRITEDMQQYLLNEKAMDDFLMDPTLWSIKEKFSKPYFLQYELPAKQSEKAEKKATSRIVYFKNSPAIGVFRSADTHPIVPNPTKHEKGKIHKNMDMYITNSSYEIITQQYQSIQHIIKNQAFMQNILQELQNLIQDKSFGPDAILQVSQTIDAVQYKTNPHTLMARLYNLSKIPFFKNRIVQQNLLFGAINKLQKREKQLGLYLYYMIPQLQALEKLHNANKENIETLHRNTLMCADGNNPWPFAIDKWQQMEQFNKHDPIQKVQRALRYHPIQQHDHLIGFFYTMHKQLGSIYKIPDNQEKNRLAKVAVYTHRLIMSAEDIKRTLQIHHEDEERNMLHIKELSRIRDDIDENLDTQTIVEYFEGFKDLHDEAVSALGDNNNSQAIQSLDKFKQAIS